MTDCPECGSKLEIMFANRFGLGGKCEKDGFHVRSPNGEWD